MSSTSRAAAQGNFHKSMKSAINTFYSSFPQRDRKTWLSFSISLSPTGKKMEKERQTNNTCLELIVSSQNFKHTHTQPEISSKRKQMRKYIKQDLWCEHEAEGGGAPRPLLPWRIFFPKAFPLESAELVLFQFEKMREKKAKENRRVPRLSLSLAKFWVLYWIEKMIQTPKEFPCKMTGNSAKWGEPGWVSDMFNAWEIQHNSHSRCLGCFSPPKENFQNEMLPVGSS